MQADDLALFMLLIVIFFAFVLPIISLPLVIWTRNSRHAKTVQWLAVLLLGVSFLGSLALAAAGAALAEYSLLGWALTIANLAALIGILSFRPESSASRLFLEILSLLFLFSFLLIGGIFVYSQMPEKYKTAKPSPTFTPKSTPTSQTPSAQASISTASWQTYNNEKYHFQIQYPAQWRYYAEGNNALIVFGPIQTKNNYPLYIKIHENPDKLSSKQWVENMLAQAKKDYESKARPNMINYESQKELTLASLAAYELYEVFDFDTSNEQIYVAKDTNVFEFEFPVAKDNPNWDDPIKNNSIVHEMLDTLKFD